VAGDLEAQALAATLGAAIRAGRRRCRLSQAELGRQVGLCQAGVSAIERGLGAGVSLSTWVAFGLSVGQPLAVGFSRAPTPGVGPSDAGHLDLQELAARHAARHGWRATFELPTRPTDPRHSADLAVRDDPGRRLLILECWNRFGDLGAAARSSSRKMAEAAGLTAAIGGERP
jgi:transcriptional regulator with XRE-family HTH domain